MSPRTMGYTKFIFDLSSLIYMYTLCVMYRQNNVKDKQAFEALQFVQVYIRL